MRSLLEGTLPPENESVQRHIAQCLGCRACETACPSGVPYGHLLEATRATLAEHRPIPFVARAILWVFERPRLLAAAMTGGRVLRALGIARLLAKLPGRPGFGMAMLASTKRSQSLARASMPSPSKGARGTVALLTGCVMEGLFAETNRATERTLSINEYAMKSAPGQGCCGALHAHAGDDAAARRLAKVNIEAFERAGADYIVVNAAGCGAMMKEYDHLLADEPAWVERAARVSASVRDWSELLAAAGPKRGGPLRVHVAYDAPCHLLHAQRIAGPPIDVLRHVGEQRTGSGRPEVHLRFLTPHSKWSIHSEFQDNLTMLTLFRGGPTLWMSVEDAATAQVADNDWVEVFNRNGVIACRAVVSHRIPKGVSLMYHSQDRHVNVPLTELSGTRGGTDNSVTRISIKPTLLIGGYAQLSYGFNYYGPTGSQRDEVVLVRKLEREIVY
jgi:Fe-S oxidoreductase